MHCTYDRVKIRKIFPPHSLSLYQILFQFLCRISRYRFIGSFRYVGDRKLSCIKMNSRYFAIQIARVTRDLIKPIGLGYRGVMPRDSIAKMHDARKVFRGWHAIFRDFNSQNYLERLVLKRRTKVDHPHQQEISKS